MIANRSIKTANMADRVEVLWSGGSPVEYLGDPHLAAALPQADACGGGVGQDVAADRLLGVGLKSETSERLKHRTGGEEAGLSQLLRHSCSRIRRHLVGNEHGDVVL